MDAAPQPEGGFATWSFAPGVGTRFCRCDERVRFQQVAKLVALVKGIKLATARGWKV